VGTTEEPAANLNPVSDHLAMAVFADRRNGLDSTLEAVKRMLRASRYEFETLVVVVAANFAFSHGISPQKSSNTESIPAE
jgi:hypothetical protein